MPATIDQIILVCYTYVAKHYLCTALLLVQVIFNSTSGANRGHQMNGMDIQCLRNVITLATLAFLEILFKICKWLINFVSFITYGTAQLLLHFYTRVHAWQHDNPIMCLRGPHFLVAWNIQFSCNSSCATHGMVTCGTCIWPHM